MHFDKRAEVYERFRPPYPDALWRRLGELGVLRDGVRVLELGAGTGEATGRLVESGATVTAVEPGKALAERLHRRVPEARILIATAEDAVVPDSAFDVVVVATAVHWLDLDFVVPRLHRATSSVTRTSTPGSESASQTSSRSAGGRNVRVVSRRPSGFIG